MESRTAPIHVSVSQPAALWFLMSCATAFGQISPGPLSHAHQDLDKITRCAACHDFGAGARGFKCLDCHTEIQRRIAAGTGFHARAYRRAAGQTDCTRCHVEHTGERVALVRFDVSKFNHQAETGYALEGTHARLACGSCHNEKKIGQAARAEIKIKNLSRSFLGLPHECSSCHQNPHGGEPGANCAGCHNQTAWRPAVGFSHSTTAFPLTGAHTRLACEKCHATPAGQKAVRFQGVASGSCRDCHGDRHKGAFQEAGASGACETCHTTAGWKTNRAAGHFHHETTAFPLRGKHADLACARCHRDADFRRPVAHDRCGSCHDDPHLGQFTARAAGSDCASCHSETGFRPSLFTREMHQMAAFHLDGKHAAVACEKCHPTESGHTRFKTGKSRCAECHADAHEGQFSNQCDQCHAASGFQPSTFTAARHAQTSFALTGAHVLAACNSCHKMRTGSAAPAVRNYRFASHSCDTCHADPHRSKLPCENCHASTEMWKSVAAFDHSKTAFPIRGAHQKLACAGCHSPALRFSGTSGRCSGCHTDVHAGQFATADRPKECSDCHTMDRWSAADFSHEKTRFPLDVAHRNISCDRCHKQQIERNGKTVRVFRPTPVECVSCH